VVGEICHCDRHSVNYQGSDFDRKIFECGSLKEAVEHRSYRVDLVVMTRVDDVLRTGPMGSKQLGSFEDRVLASLYYGTCSSVSVYMIFCWNIS